MHANDHQVNNNGETLSTFLIHSCYTCFNTHKTYKLNFSHGNVIQISSVRRLNGVISVCKLSIHMYYHMVWYSIYYRAIFFIHFFNLSAWFHFSLIRCYCYIIWCLILLWCIFMYYYWYENELKIYDLLKIKWKIKNKIILFYYRETE